jgi:hypothetical protein
VVLIKRLHAPAAYPQILCSTNLVLPIYYVNFIIFYAFYWVFYCFLFFMFFCTPCIYIPTVTLCKRR